MDVPRRPDGSFSEAAARDARYRALASVAVREGAAAIATGHTADDQAETVLLHAVRGAGLAGLRAMSVLSDAPIDDGAGIRLFRPLLGVRRSETQAYCRELGLTPLHDETNDDVRIPRNLLRLEAMPLLERLNPQAVSALARLADTAGGALDFMEAALDAEWPAMASASDGAVSLDRERFRALHPALQGLAVRRAHQQAVGDARDAGRGARGGGAAAGERPLGQGGRAAGRRPHGSAPRGAGVPPSGTRTALVAAIEGEHPLTVPGVSLMQEWRVKAEIVPMPASLQSPAFTAHLDADSLGGLLCLRGRRPGDRFQPLGLERGSKKLQDYFVDAQVPRRERDTVPLLVSPKGVVWVAGHAIAHWARVTPETRRVLRVELARADGA